MFERTGGNEAAVRIKTEREQRPGVYEPGRVGWGGDPRIPLVESIGARLVALSTIAGEVRTNPIFLAPGRIGRGCQGAQGTDAGDVAGEVPCLA